MSVPRKPVPTTIPGGDETVNHWLLEWSRDRRELERLEGEHNAIRDDVKRWQKRASDVVAELDASEKIVKETRHALLHLWEWATTVACRSGIGDRYLNEARRVLFG